MRSIVFLLATSLLIVAARSHSTGLYKQTVMDEAIMPDGEFVDPGIEEAFYASSHSDGATCGQCENTVFEIKCGGDHGSAELCNGCALTCKCGDVAPPAAPEPAAAPAGGGGGGVGAVNLAAEIGMDEPTVETIGDDDTANGGAAADGGGGF